MIEPEPEKNIDTFSPAGIADEVTADKKEIVVVGTCACDVKVYNPTPTPLT